MYYKINSSVRITLRVLLKVGTFLWEAGSWVGRETWGGGENPLIREKKKIKKQLMEMFAEI